MKRKYYTSTLTSDAGAEIATGRTRYAMNSAIRETEAMVRELARSEGVFYHGQQPERVGQAYTRRWVSDTGRVVNAHAALTSG